MTALMNRIRPKKADLEMPPKKAEAIMPRLCSCMAAAR